MSGIVLSDLAFVSFGSNQGDSRQLFAAACDFLQTLSDFPILKSSLWRSAPIDCPPGSPDFLNAVLAFKPRPNETPESLLNRLLLFERKTGRSPSAVRNAPRTIDLDLIAFGTERRRTAELILPHPRATQRRFVLEPLAELAPDLILPGESRTVSQLLSSMDSTKLVERVEQ